MWKLLLLLVGVLRIVTPPFIFLFPVPVTIAMIILDFDGYLAFKSGWQWRRYHTYDKFLDFWWNIFILLFSSQLPIFLMILILFVYRGIGQFLSILTGNEKILFYFPNITERYFWLYGLSWFIPFLSFLFIGNGQFIPLLIALGPTMVIEYFTHIRRLSFYQFNDRC